MLIICRKKYKRYSSHWNLPNYLYQIEEQYYTQSQFGNLVQSIREHQKSKPEKRNSTVTSNNNIQDYCFAFFLYTYIKMLILLLMQISPATELYQLLHHLFAEYALEK